MFYQTTISLPKIRLTIHLFIVICLLFTSCTHNTLFKKLSADDTGITFNNAIQENDTLNTLDLEFLYNGGGVAVGDFNNDGLPDLYFTASVTPNKLYINKGNLKFEDVTDKADVSGEGEWSNAASIIDINNDGFEDIYVCTTIKTNPQQRRNLLYINQGKQPDNIPRFKEMAAEYGLADTSFSVHAAFLDYDNDGDLDMYLATTKLAKRASTSLGIRDTSTEDYDRFFRNDWDAQLNHPVFTDVSKAVGIHAHGYGLGIAVVDINKDGWKDVFVTNDFFSNDHLYINNKNGTFTDKVRDYFKHTARNAMGNAVADINNDGLEDVFTVDMNPEDNYRKKKNMSGYNYYEYQRMLYDSNELQYVRNTLQLNMGPRVNGNDSIGAPVFGDISFLTGTAETDWSWNPSIADFDNDGNNDIIVTNGYPRDVTDHDFIAFRGMATGFTKKQDIINEIPIIKVPNYAFKNRGDLQFENITEQWGLHDLSFSNGGVAVDLDNDGDLDYVINNINEEAFVYENTLNSKGKVQRNYLKIAFDGGTRNRKGIGATAELHYGTTVQVFDNEPCRGYLSCTDSKAFFGLDSTKVIDTLIIHWSNHKQQILTRVKANQLLTVNINNAHEPDSWDTPQLDTAALFTDITAQANIRYKQLERDYIDFDKERLLPHKLSQYGPGLAAGDINGDGLDDLYIGGNTDQGGTLLLQQSNGQFKQVPFPAALQQPPSAQQPEDMGVLLFDADGDGDNDLWCASGSDEYEANSSGYADRFYRNDGKGNFRLDSAAIPRNYTSKSCLKAADYDGDGDLDLFIGGRCLPGNYPMPVSSFIYRNDSKNGTVRFTDVTASVCKDLQNIGMVCDALWTDFDNDGAIDLVLAGEWMPLTFFKNKGGRLENITQSTGLAAQKGWWSSIAGGDFDNDGDIDYVAGNLGLNAFIRGSDKEPVKVYAKDFDNNGNIDPVLTLYLKDQQGVKREYPALTRDDITSQLPALKKKYNAYKDFAVAGIRDMFTPEQLAGALVLEANNFASCYIENKGSGRFELKPLPVMAQLAPLNGMQTGDFNGDGKLDIAMCGNDYGNEITAGRYDAMNGLVMLGDGAGHFTAQTILQSGWYVPEDAKAVVALKGADSTYLLAASQNKGALKLFKRKLNSRQMVAVQPGDRVAYLTLNNGSKRKEELYYGTSFLSQSARFIERNSSIKQIEIINAKGEKRIIQ